MKWRLCPCCRGTELQIRQLQGDPGVQLFARNSPGVRLTWPGQVFLEEARCVLANAEQARASARAAATGYRGLLRMALSDGISPSRMSALLARCREEAPEVVRFVSFMLITLSLMINPVPTLQTHSSLE
jgi:DNA-binding transcriptional LysR family regulator